MSEVTANKNSDIKVGFIGSSWVGTQHCEAMKQIPGVKLAAICDVVVQRAHTLAKRVGIEHVYDNYHDLIAQDLDAVVIGTPTAIHGKPAIDAMNAGKHVLVEKPMEADFALATEMVRTAKKTGKILMTALKLRFSREVQFAKKIISEGALGEIYYGEAISDRRRGNPGGNFIRKDLAGIGALGDIGIYSLDTLIHIMGDPKPVAVSALVNNRLSRTLDPILGAWNPDVKNTEVDDFSAAWIRFENGLRLVFKTCWAMHMDTLGGTFLLGDKGGLRIGVRDCKGSQPGVQLFRDEFGALSNVQFEKVVDLNVNEFLVEDTHFINAIREGKPSPTEPKGVLYTNMIFDGCMRSSAQGGKEVDLIFPEI